MNLLYAAAALACSPWIAWRVAKKARPIVGWREKLTGRVAIKPCSAPRIWLHAVSVGEVNLLAHAVPRLKQQFAGWDFVISTTTQTGRELANRRFPDDQVCFWPFDFTWSVSAALDRIAPDLIVLAELEIWPNLLREAARREIPVTVINARLSDASFRWYRRLKTLLRPSFARITAVAAQDEQYATRFKVLGVDLSRVTVSGNMKFDGARGDRDHGPTRRFAEWLGNLPDQVIWLAGSTQEPEEAIVGDCYLALKKCFPQLRLILAPRHPERCASVIDQLKSRGLNVVRRTTLTARDRLQPDDVLVIDTVGELAAWWGVAQVAFVGGSLGDRGGQNMIEPAAFGCAVCFGPNTKNFRDVVSLLLNHSAATVVRDPTELRQFVTRCLTDPDWREKLGSLARRVVLAQSGATDWTVAVLENTVRTYRPLARRAA